MKKSKLTKIISLLLTAVMLLSAVPLTAVAVRFERSPIIYIGGMTENVLYMNPNKLNSKQVYNVYSEDFQMNLSNIGAAFLTASFNKDIKKAVPSVLKGINGIMGPIACAENGESRSSKIGPWSYPKPVSNYKKDEIYTENMQAIIKAADKMVSEDEIFWFSYDWRISPVDNALKLRHFIDDVEAATSKNKVSLLAASNGGVIANTYLYEHMDHARVNVSSCVFYDAPLLGNAVIGDFMKGTIAKTLKDDDSLIGAIQTITGEERGQAMFDYMKADPIGIIKRMFDNIIGVGPESTLIDAVFKIILIEVMKGEDIHKKLGKSYNEFALVADKNVYDDCLAEYLRNMPGLWALVPEADYDDAVDFIFNDLIPDKDLMAKIRDCRKAQYYTEETLKKAKLSGINVCIVANYGIPLLPATVSMNDVSDGIQSVKYSSAGAITTDNSKDWPYSDQCTMKHNHRSPDGDIDARTCFLPESTWFIKDLGHNTLKYDSVADFVMWLLTATSQRNIYDNPSYTQYLKYNKYNHTIRAYSDPDDPQAEYKYGDPDMDGQITASDARSALRYSVEIDYPSKIIRVVIDVDGDGDITASDARLILRHSVGIINKFPVEQ